MTLITKPRGRRASTCYSRQNRGRGSRMPARLTREGQGSKHSWLPADNPASGWNCSQEGWLPLQEPCREHTGSDKGNLPPAPPLTGWVQHCSGSHSPIGMQVAGSQRALPHSLAPMQVASTDNWRMLICGSMQLPGGCQLSNLAPSKMEGAVAVWLESRNGGLGVPRMQSARHRT